MPDDAVLIAGSLIWQNIRADVLQEFAEDAVEHQEVNTLWRVLLIDRSDVVTDEVGDVRDLFCVFPNLIEELDEGPRCGRLVHSVDEVRDRIPLLVAKVNGSESMQGHVHGFSSDDFTQANCCMGAPLRLERNWAFRRIQSAHSLAMARWVSLFFSRSSNSVPKNPFSFEG